MKRRRCHAETDNSSIVVRMGASQQTDNRQTDNQMKTIENNDGNAHLYGVKQCMPNAAAGEFKRKAFRKVVTQSNEKLYFLSVFFSSSYIVICVFFVLSIGQRGANKTTEVIRKRHLRRRIREKFC